jgi:hypothetical protein
VAKLEELVRNKVLKVNSMRFFSELKTFVWNSGKAEALRGYNDDLVLAGAIACWVRETALVANYHETEYKKAILGAMKSSRKVFDTKINGMQGYKTNHRQPGQPLKGYDFNDLPFFVK